MFKPNKFVTNSLIKYFRSFSNYVPEHNCIPVEEKREFIEFLDKYNNILVLTGAGVSTESGIPDYRSEKVGLYSKSNYKPIDYSTFLKDSKARTRYWARNFVGWPQFSSASPNKIHFFLSTLQEIPGKLLGIITQNVDGLHYKAGSNDVIELHGNSFWVQCLQCKDLISRSDFQKTLQQLNPNFDISSTSLRPDGDVDITQESIKNFVTTDCEKCGGILKPCVVFFGDNVPTARVEKVKKLVNDCEALLVMGTSLSTQSSYRIVDQAFELCKYICIVNIGPTRANEKADLIINGLCSEVIPRISIR